MLEFKLGCYSAGTWVFLPKNWQPGHRLTRSSASEIAIGQKNHDLYALPTSVLDSAWLPQTPWCIFRRMSLPSSRVTQFMRMPEAERLYRLSPTRTKPLLRLVMRAASALLGSTCGGSLNSLMKSINWVRQSSSIISTSLTVAGASVPVAYLLCSLTDGWWSSWTKTPGGTAARVDPSLERTSAPTLLFRSTWWISNPENLFSSFLVSATYASIVSLLTFHSLLTCWTTSRESP